MIYRPTPKGINITKQIHLSTWFILGSILFIWYLFTIWEKKLPQELNLFFTIVPVTVWWYVFLLGWIFFARKGKIRINFPHNIIQYKSNCFEWSENYSLLHIHYTHRQRVYKVAVIIYQILRYIFYKFYVGRKLAPWIGWKDAQLPTM